MVRYQKQWHRVLNAEYNYSHKDWNVCLNDEKYGLNSHIWCSNHDLTPIFDSDWRSHSNKFFVFEESTINQADGKGKSSEVIANSGEILKKLIGHFDENEAKILEQVNKIKNDGDIDECGVTKHARYNEFGFAMKAFDNDS